MKAYMVDYDKRVTLCIDDEEKIAGFILSNNLELAYGMFNSKEELKDNLSLDEMLGCIANIDKNSSLNFKSEKSASSELWDLLQEHSLDQLSLAVSKGILKTFKSDSKDVPKQLGGGGNTPKEKPIKQRSKSPRSSTATKRSKLLDTSNLVSGEEPKQTTILHSLWLLLDDNMGELTVSELVALSDLDEVKCRKNITRSIRKGYINRVDT